MRRIPARSIGDLQDIVRAVKTPGASLKATEQPIDTGTAAGTAGVYKGRPASIDAAAVREMKAQGSGPASEIAKALKIGRASAYRPLNEQAATAS